jgi:hypothetical protein
VGEGSTGEPQANQERLTVAQAATRLGITEGAVRSRIKRGTLPTTKERGTVFVLWVGGTSKANQATNTDALSAQSELIEALRDQIEDLRQERDEWREQARITDRLLSAAMERIPAIEAPPEASEAAETVEETPDRVEPWSATAEAQDELGAERPRREMAESTLREGMAEERRRREEAERERDELRRELHAHGRQQEAPEAAEEQQGRDQSQSAAGGAQEGARRPWWRRVFGR